MAAAPSDGGPQRGRNYTYYLSRHILPAFGTMCLVGVLPVDVREWVTEVKDAGVSPKVIRSCFAILSAIFTTAFNDQFTQLHPCLAVTCARRRCRRRCARSSAQPSTARSTPTYPTTRLLVETDIETGLRWGELTELRPIDIDDFSRALTGSGVVLELVPKFHHDGGRFPIKQHPKDREHRRLS